MSGSGQGTLEEVRDDSREPPECPGKVGSGRVEGPLGRSGTIQGSLPNVRVRSFRDGLGDP